MTILVCNLSRDHAKAWNALGTSAASLIKMHWQSSKEGLWPAWRRLGAATELATLRATSNHAGMAAHRELRGSPAVADRFPVQSATCVLQTILMLRPRPTHLDKGVAGAGAAEDGGALQPYPGGVSDATGQRGAHRGRRRRQRGRCGHGERRPAVGHRRPWMYWGGFGVLTCGRGRGQSAQCCLGPAEDGRVGWAGARQPGLQAEGQPAPQPSPVPLHTPTVGRSFWHQQPPAHLEAKNNIRSLAAKGKGDWAGAAHAQEAADKGGKHGNRLACDVPGLCTHGRTENAKESSQEAPRTVRQGATFNQPPRPQPCLPRFPPHLSM